MHYVLGCHSETLSVTCSIERLISQPVFTQISVFPSILHQSSAQFPGAPGRHDWEKEMVEAYLVPGFPPSLLWDCHCWSRAGRSRVKVMDCHGHRCGVEGRPAALPPRDLLCLHLRRGQSYRMRRQSARGREVLGIRSERKQNKTRNVCLVFKAHSSVCVYPPLTGRARVRGGETGTISLQSF